VSLFARHHRPRLVGVVHLLPLPGSPSPSPGLAEVLSRARADARALASGGADAIIVENLGDAPFTVGPAAPYTVAAMARAVLAVGEVAAGLPIGVNVLRNDGPAALAIAAATGARFIRVNVHVGVMVTDQGVITGEARHTLLERNRLGSEVRIAADVLVKHAVPLGDQHLDQVARDTWHRGRADALIVTGTGTGRPVDRPDLERVRGAVPGCTLWVGSGLCPEQARAISPLVDGAIVGTWLHRDTDLGAPLELERIRAMRSALVPQ